MVSPSPSTSPLQLKRTGNSMGPKSTVRNRSSRAAPAGAMREVWKGPLTFRGSTRLAPASLARRAGLLHGGGVAADDDLSGAVQVGDLRHAQVGGGVAALLELLPAQHQHGGHGAGAVLDGLGHGLPPEGHQLDGGPGSKTPAAHRAEYSPRLSPAAMAGRMPFS